MYSLGEIFFFFILVFVLIYWWQSRGLKEVAYVAAKNYCQKMDVELLDQAIYLRKFWMKRDEQGTLRGWRSYYFEFSTNGDDRYQGRVVMLGQNVIKLELEPHRLQ